VPEEEWCDGLDNDCNGVADDHFACPDDSVANTAPFSGGIYRTGETPSFPCGSHALQQFWPERASSYRTGLACHVVWYRFRRSDGALYYHDLIDGLFRDGASATTADDVPVAMPCKTELPIQPSAWFDFDGKGTLHYQCGTQLLRGDGEVVAGSIIESAGVLDDGRVIITRPSGGVSKFVVLGPQGDELNALPPPGFFTGEIWPMPFATTVRGNTAYVALERVYGQVLREAVVYEVDEDSNFRLVRRAAISVRMGNYGFEDSISLVISDGTVFMVGDDPMPSGPPRSLLNVYLPDNTTRVFHQDAEPTDGRVFGFGLVPGPRE
jgi:hypothetical protein